MRQKFSVTNRNRPTAKQKENNGMYIADVNPTTRSFTLREQGDKGGSRILIVNNDNVGKCSRAKWYAFKRQSQGWVAAKDLLECCLGKRLRVGELRLEVDNLDKLGRAIEGMGILFRTYDALRRHPKVVSAAFVNELDKGVSARIPIQG